MTTISHELEKLEQLVALCERSGAAPELDTVEFIRARIEALEIALRTYRKALAVIDGLPPATESRNTTGTPPGNA